LGLSGLGVLLVILTGWLTIHGWPIERELQLDAIQHGEGASFVTPLRTGSVFLSLRYDTDQQPTRSDLRLFEDGRELGPGHTLHVEIARDGGGRFSHWGDNLIFSATDSSDPVTNARHYHLVSRGFMPRGLALGLCALGVLLAVIGLRRGREAVAIHPNQAVISSAYAFGAATIAFVILFSLVGWQINRTIPSQSIMAGAGATHMANLESGSLLLTLRPDTMSDPKRSTFKAFENGAPLGPAHSNHAEIAKKGTGPYSHWGDYLYFSSSDNSDPATNGRRYSYQAAVYPSWIAAVILVLAGAGSMLAAYLTAPLKIRALSASWLAVGSRLWLDALILSGAVLIVIAILDPRALVGFSYALRSEVRALVGTFIAAAAGFAVFGRFPDRPSLWVGLIRGLLLLGLSGLLGLELSQMLWPAVIGLAAALAFRYTRYQPIELRAIASISAHTSYRGVQIAAVLLGIFAIMPEVLDFWRESGLWDSNGYDLLAQQIASGKLPFASSFYMPLYQYGMASLYWAFGHFWEVQKAVNVLLGLAAILLLTDIAHMLTGSLLVAAVMSVWAAFYQNLHHAPWTTQIEGWYIPAFALAVWAAIRYLQRPSLVRISGLALCAAIVLNIRLQGVFFCSALLLVTFISRDMRLKDRVRHILAFSIIFVVIGWLPWSVRNFAVGGRFSPSSEQAAQVGAIQNDPRIGLYGLRYGETFNPILMDYMKRYPDPAERQRFFDSYLAKRLLSDPLWFAEAAPWRLGAFYGLIPNVYFASDTASFDWSSEWRQYISNHYPFLAMIAAAILGLVARPPGRFSLFIVVLIGANAVISLLVGVGEPRLSYPVHILHAILALTAFVPGPALGYAVFSDRPGLASLLPSARYLLGGLGAATLVFALIHNTFGRQRIYRTLDGEYASFVRTVEIDRIVPLVGYDGAQETYLGPRLSINGEVVDKLQIGSAYRGIFTVTAGMHPPRWAGVVDGIPADANDWRLPPFYLLWIQKLDIEPDLTPERAALGMLAGQLSATAIPARLLNTTASDPLREQDVIEAEFRVVAQGSYSGTGEFIEILKAKILRRAD